MSTSASQILCIQQQGYKAWQLKQQGWRHGAIAVALNVPSQTIDQWLELAKTSTKALPPTNLSPGYSAGLTDEQQQRLCVLLQRLPSDFGFQTQQWSLQQVNVLIQQLFDISLPALEVEGILQLLTTQTEAHYPTLSGGEQSVQRTTMKKQHRIRNLQLWALNQQLAQKPSEGLRLVGTKRQEAITAPTDTKVAPATPTKFKAGPPTKLTLEQLQTLPELLLKPPQAYGLTGTVWTYKQIALMIEQVYHVSFSPDYIPDFLKRARRRLEKAGR